MNQNMKPKSGVSRMTSWLLLLAFAAPMVAAWVMFNYFPEVVHALGTTNHGEFAKPYPQLELKGFKDREGREINAEYVKGKWTILYIDSGKCEKECQENLLKARQIRIAQGPEMDRVQRLLVLQDTGNLDMLKEFLQPQTDLTVVSSDKEVMDRFLAKFKLDTKVPFLATRLYLVDPMGTVMMYYEFDPADKEMHRENGMRLDLKKLLKNSKIG